MSTYTLSARLDTMFEVVAIEAVDDVKAFIKATGILMGKAMHDGNPDACQRLWARGEITFRNNEGEILKQLGELI